MANNRDNIKFYLDVEATDLSRGNQEKVFSGSTINSTPGRGSIPQLIQFFGGTSQEISSYTPGNPQGALNEHISLKVNDPDYYNKLNLEFTYKPEGDAE